jgi:uncharacterized protein (TIGR03084 family)
MADLDGLLDDLAAEGADLDGIVADLLPEDWARPTPAEGWTIAHQIAHLAWTDDTAVLAATDEPAFAAVVERARADPAQVDDAASDGARQAPGELLDRWRRGRAAVADALRAVPPGTKLPWFGPPMSAASMATARLMETWAHGQDIADALDVERIATARLRHVAHLGVRTRDFAFVINGREPPAEEFRVELSGPALEEWVWGPDDASQRVTGPALDFCLLVTQRRHRVDLDITALGGEAEAWLGIAQAFAGRPGAGRARRR